MTWKNYFDKFFLRGNSKILNTFRYYSVYSTNMVHIQKDFTRCLLSMPQSMHRTLALWPFKLLRTLMFNPWIGSIVSATCKNKCFVKFHDTTHQIPGNRKVAQSFQLFSRSNFSSRRKNQNVLQQATLHLSWDAWATWHVRYANHPDPANLLLVSQQWSSPDDHHPSLVAPVGNCWSLHLV